MDKSPLLYLVTLEAMGSMSKKDSSELLHAMQNDKDFPWQEMGEYQNLAALLSLVVNQETPEKSLKEKILNEIVKIKQEKFSPMINSKLPDKQEKTAKKKDEEKADKDTTAEEPDEVNDNKKSEVKIVDHLGEFEQVKSKLIKIKDVQKKPAVTKKELKIIADEKILEEDFEEIPFVKNPKPQKPTTKIFRKKYIIAASLVLVVFASFGFFYLNFFNDDIKEQMQLAEKETELLISKSRIIPKEQLPVVLVENIEQVELIVQDEPNEQVELIETENNQPEESNVQKEENTEPEFPPEMIEIQKEKNSQKLVSPPPKTPDFIEAPLIVEEEKIDDNKNVNQLAGTPPEQQPPPTKKKVEEEEPVYFVAVEEMPEPIGGIGEIQKKIIYPEIAKRAGLEGKVLVNAFVDESGNVIKVEVIKGIGLGCDEAAVNAVLQTKFKPGKQRGKSVKVKITIPITFKL